MTGVYRVRVGGGLAGGVILSGYGGATRFSNADPWRVTALAGMVKFGDGFVDSLLPELRADSRG